MALGEGVGLGLGAGRGSGFGVPIPPQEKLRMPYVDATSTADRISINRRPIQKKVAQFC